MSVPVDPRSRESMAPIPLEEPLGRIADAPPEPVPPAAPETAADAVERDLREGGPLIARRARNQLLFLAASIGSLYAVRLLDQRLAGSILVTGWALFFLMFLLAVYGVKKKLPFLPLGKSASWLQLHLYAGALSLVIYGAHAGLKVPRGPLELLLAVLYVVVAGSGIVGIVVSRSFPPRLRAAGEPVLYERLPRLRREIREEAEARVLAAVSASGATTVADVYASRLAPFFAQPRNLLAHLLGARTVLREVLDEVDDAFRYADDAEKKVLEELKDLVRAKNVLDANHALQWGMRAWLFVHVPATGALLMTAIVHATLVYGFRGAP